jgi:hypothetical protein
MQALLWHSPQRMIQQVLKNCGRAMPILIRDGTGLVSKGQRLSIDTGPRPKFGPMRISDSNRIGTTDRNCREAKRDSP